jgi:hypothetical protein
MPLEGNYFLECSDTEGNPFFTGELGWNANAGQVHGKLVEACPWLRDAMSVWDGFDYTHREDGLDFVIRFDNVKGSLNQFKVHPSDTKPLKGNNMQIESITYDTYGPNVYYDVIPFEQLYTYDRAPAIRAKVDGMPVLCKSTMCAYTYVDNEARIKAFSVLGTDVTIDGEFLPT